MCLRSRHGSAAWFCYALRFWGRIPWVTYECQLYGTGSLGQQHGSSGEKENACQLKRREADRRMRAEPTNVPCAWPRPRHERRSASNRTETNDLQLTNSIAKWLRTNPTRPHFQPQPAEGITPTISRPVMSDGQMCLWSRHGSAAWFCYLRFERRAVPDRFRNSTPRETVWEALGAAEENLAAMPS